VREVQPGVWHWEAPHPEWGPGDSSLEWDRQEVSSYAIDDGDRLLLFDPLAAAGREPAIVLTCPWHERDSRSLLERLDAAVFVPRPEEGEPIEGRQLFSAGDRLPVGVDAFPGKEPNDLVLWVESRRALVSGDTLIDRGPGLEFPRTWVPEDVPPEQILEALRPLLELPVELVLATHGGPADRAALERALDA
jgi:glyoxylase-like metal-dependent hydrolase (beta-lactamase superfamily II)